MAYEGGREFDIELDGEECSRVEFCIFQAVKSGLFFWVDEAEQFSGAYSDINIARKDLLNYAAQL